MANNLIQIKRTSVSGRAANTTTLPNPGQLALNMTDGILYSGNGSVVFEIGANNTNSRVTNLLTANAIQTDQKISVGNNSVNTEITAGVIRLNGSEIYIGNNTTLTGNNVSVGNVSITEDAVIINGLFALTSETAGVANNSLYLGGVAANQYVTKSELLTSNVTSDQFIANGTQTSFTLSSSINNQNNSLVIVNGLVQTPNIHYTITGAELDFNFTLPSNTAVEVKSLESFVGFSPTPTPITQSIYESYSGLTNTQTGTMRKYIGTAATLSKIAAWSANTGDQFTVLLKKNGATVANVSVNSTSNFSSTTFTASMNADSDYITFDISSGSGTDIGIRVDYTS